MKVEITSSDFDPWAEIRAYQERCDALMGNFGATACFVGTMRDFNDGDGVSRMTLEHYPGMTERELEKIVADALNRFPIIDALVIHRVGDLSPNDPIVAVAVWSAHRAAAFDSCRMIMETLKTTAPFWKKEYLECGTRWVEKNTAG